MSEENKDTILKTTTDADLAFLSPIEEIIEDARNGKMFVLVDDEDRENEGDLVIPAQMATPEAINFMAKYGRGLICLTLTPKRADELGLRLMPQSNSSRFGTAFTVSIEAREGVTTGISAPDRARTVAVAIDPNSSEADITTPGHVFPLVAREGGVLVRAGHTEATVDISRLAGLNASSVICEIMNDEGEMARLPELIKFAQFHGLKIGAIADLIAYRRRYDHMVRKTEETIINSAFGGEFKLQVYVNELSYAEHVVLVKGDISHGGPVLVRMHAMNVLEDVLGDQSRGKQTELHKCMERIAEEGRGVIVLLREPHARSLSTRVRAKENLPPVGDEVQDLRDYGVGAQILLDLGIQDMILLSNTDKNIIGLDGYGLKVVERRPID
ncbi:MAG: 3,4-dihydroxy-2-butanone-4-phosphate synthase [Alphaproteobacteria bacterium]|nr:3,4-dihydroxy-2-butanone-4-phosphate synthase [Alphaproteobacteria bacterium]